MADRHLVKYIGKRSKYYKIKIDKLQGRVLFPNLFNLYLSLLPPQRAYVVSFPNSITIFVTAEKVL